MLPPNSKNYCISKSTLLISLFFLVILASFLFFYKPSKFVYFKEPFVLKSVGVAPQIKIEAADALTAERISNCNHYDCLDLYKCGSETYTISIYIYPVIKFVDEDGVLISVPHSKEFISILNTISNSKYYTSDPSKACFFVPSLDLLNQDRIRLKGTSQALAMLPHWNNGSNHLLFTMLPGTLPEYYPALEVGSGHAINVAAGFSTWTYRPGLDISIPVFADKAHHKCDTGGDREWLVTSSQVNIHHTFRNALKKQTENNDNLLILNKCADKDAGKTSSSRCVEGSESQASYPHILKKSTFCLVIRGGRLGQRVLMEAMMSGCIPIVVVDNYVMPFSEVLDWKRAALFLYEEELENLMSIVKSISEEQVKQMRSQVCFLWTRYMSSMEDITSTTLELLNERVFPHTTNHYQYWNDPPQINQIKPPLLLPMVAPKIPGFTAVILTYDRLESLFYIIQKVVEAPSLAKVVVVWNNQKKSPPPVSKWPLINRPLKIVRTRENKLSNRFFPYEEIETDAILALDDDIVMLTADEIEFGFEVWREYPDRIVGFPSRVHLWDNVTAKWKYESEWTNDISMVLTGAAFYHKYYNELYTYSMPGDIKNWVDTHMNCEDIAMNFLVANLTGNAPIKVTPRKKFKCPECTNVEMLSADVLHMVERSHCINRFASVYQTMPLRTVEFRADPVLFKDNFPEKLKRFNTVGSL